MAYYVAQLADRSRTRGNANAHRIWLRQYERE